MKSLLGLFLSLVLSQCRTFINTDLSRALPGTDRANPPSQPEMKYLWRNSRSQSSLKTYWPEEPEEVKLRRNKKLTKGRDHSKTNSKAANDEGMGGVNTLS